MKNPARKTHTCYYVFQLAYDRFDVPELRGPYTLAKLPAIYTEAVKGMRLGTTRRLDNDLNAVVFYLRGKK